MGQCTDFYLNSEFPSAWQLKLWLPIMDVPLLVFQLDPAFYPTWIVATSEKTECIYPVRMTLSFLVLGTLIEGAG